MSHRSGYDVVIPAGGTIDAGYAKTIGTPFRALAPLGPKRRPVLQNVMDALRASGIADRIIVVAPPEVEAALTGADVWLRAGENGGRNILAGLAQACSSRLALVCPSDLPLLTPESIAEFCALCRTEAEVAVGLVRAADYHAAFPGAPASQFVTLSDTGPVTLGSLFLVNPALILREAALLETLFSARKSQWELARLLGRQLLWGWAARRLNLPMVTARTEKILGARIQVVAPVSPLLAYDIDSLDDYTYANQFFH